MQETCMCWGLACGNGWYKIIDTMSKELTAYAKKHGVAIECEQVKEKFGTLRVYLNASNDATDKIVAKAEKASAKTCEHCGKPGRIRETGWVMIACDKCFKERKK